MRIIPDNADVICNSMMEPTYYHKTDTIEIIDDEWDKIGTDFRCNLYLADDPSKLKKFSQYLRELLALARTK